MFKYLFVYLFVLEHFPLAAMHCLTFVPLSKYISESFIYKKKSVLFESYSVIAAAASTVASASALYHEISSDQLTKISECSSQIDPLSLRL